MLPGSIQVAPVVAVGLGASIYVAGWHRPES
jgi:hypothetical protein